MGSLAKVRIGEHAPDFVCDAVLAGQFKEISLSHYINNRQWLLLMFIPAAFSFVCPTEVLAFQNTLDEFTDRNCAVAFVSVDTKHSLWHWQSLPPRFGGLGKIDLPLLADPSHKMSKDYGCLIENEGLCLRGMFIIDPIGIVQQITMNNLAVGRSVLEALRLVEAFQAVIVHGVLCPANWTLGADTVKDDYDERFARLQAEFGDVEVTDLDAKHGLSRTVSNSSRRSHRGTPSMLSPRSVSRIPSGSSSWATARGSKVRLEFADPVESRPATPAKEYSSSPTLEKVPSRTLNEVPSRVLNGSPILQNLRARSETPISPGSTRLQQTFEALRKLGTGLGTPKLELEPRTEKEEDSQNGVIRDKSYFAIVPENA